MNRNRFKLLSGTISLALILSACVGPTLPVSGTPSEFDGLWTGLLESDESGCSDVTAEFEVRYGQLLGKIYQQGVSKADFWGEIGSDGKLNANIGLLGVSAGGADITFAKGQASGPWFSEYCKGMASLNRT
ncbi:hypothetical protein [Kiloniella sp.]|uniref:hypothetical protein n=1 Tax=Kiloniella sp. TaxID=1938587 RepID=UPI003B010DF6